VITLQETRPERLRVRDPQRNRPPGVRRKSKQPHCSAQHKLKNGEVVEIITSKDASPVATACVRQTRKLEARSRSGSTRRRGKTGRFGTEAAREGGTQVQDLLEAVLSGGASRVYSPIRDSRTEDLYPSGFGKMAPRQILSALFPDVSPLTEEKAKPSPIAAVVQKVLGRGESPITVKVRTACWSTGPSAATDPGRRSSRLHNARIRASRCIRPPCRRFHFLVQRD